MMEYQAMLWLIFMCILIGIEIVTVGLYTIWFAGGALISFFATMLGFGIWVQLWSFVIVSAVLLITTRPLLVKKFNGRFVKTELDTPVGKRVILTERVDNRDRTGRTIWNNLEWRVCSQDDNVTFEEGATVTVTAVEGVKLIVK